MPPTQRVRCQPGPQVGPAARPGQPVRPAVQGHAGAGRALPHRGLAAGRCRGPRGHPGPGTEPAGCSEHPGCSSAPSPAPAACTERRERAMPSARTPWLCSTCFSSSALENQPLPAPSSPGACSHGASARRGAGGGGGAGGKFGGLLNRRALHVFLEPHLPLPTGPKSPNHDCWMGRGGAPRTPRIGIWGPWCLPAPKPPHNPLGHRKVSRQGWAQGESRTQPSATTPGQPGDNRLPPPRVPTRLRKRSGCTGAEASGGGERGGDKHQFQAARAKAP